MTTLNLDSIVDITVSVSPSAAPRFTFNQLLILGPSTVIPVEERVREYTTVAEMLTDGFIITDPEYLAAQVYFAQTPAPQVVWIGRLDATVSPPEEIIDALIACRAASSEWYQCYATEVITAEIEAIAAWAETATPSTVFVYDTSDSAILDPGDGGIAETLKDLSYKKTLGTYSTSDYIGAGIMGVANGLNNGLANSAYTLKFKEIVSALTENLTYNQVQVIESHNCNVYVSYADYYDVYEQGVMANGYFYDQIVNRDMLVNDIQLACMDLLTQNPKIPQTESGMTMIHNALSIACQNALNRGYLGPGTYTGIPFLALNTNDPMPNGYVIQSQPLSEQSAADRALRKAAPFYVTIKEAGAVHSITIEVIVNV